MRIKGQAGLKIWRSICIRPRVAVGIVTLIIGVFAECVLPKVARDLLFV
jgi:hypothetical protein